MIEIVSLVDRPDLLPTLAHWAWHAFWGPDEHTLEEVLRAYAASTRPGHRQQSFMALEGATPLGTASLVEQDLAERPNLTPWLAAVYTLPEHRGHGVATSLLHAVEDAARARGDATLWLYTHTAEPLYARLGWLVHERVPRQAAPEVAVMRRTL